ncbi:hypothetical protein HID58_068182 [Brassica napus]|uniref:Uncharacterized protein n=1 Tax=Brassica napus TaxID=3708 RepID=A0ABQ7ZKT8_BRANA|nr:hypothetical protein HID58_068182 [Brassica napus]
MISYLGNSGPRTTGIPITATLASLWINNSWALPSARSNKMEEVLTHLTTISLSLCTDIAVWDTSGSGQNQNTGIEAKLKVLYGSGARKFARSCCSSWLTSHEGIVSLSSLEFVCSQ